MSELKLVDMSLTIMISRSPKLKVILTSMADQPTLFQTIEVSYQARTSTYSTTLIKTKYMKKSFT